MKLHINRNSSATKLTMGGFLIALGVLLPYVTAHAFGVPGNVLLPMHLPVLFAGFLLGPIYGMLCGILIPTLSSLLTGMPPLFPMLPLMIGELGVYGLVSGLLYYKTPLGRIPYGIFPSLIGAMIAGRAMYGIIFNVMLLATPEKTAFAAVLGSIIKGIPGIIIQLILIPVILVALDGAFLKRHRIKTNDLTKALKLIRTNQASCVLIRDCESMQTLNDRGIAPIMKLLNENKLQNAIVVDKIVGKAAAMLLVLGGAKSVYAMTMSQSAFDFLKKHNIPASCDTLIAKITNRTGDGLCPMETTVLDIEEPAIAKEKLQETISRLQKQK